MEALLEAGNALLDFLYPPKCYLCGNVGAYLCETCIAGWPRPEAPRCPHCGQPLPIGVCKWCENGMQPLAIAAFPFAFEDSVREIVHLLKYRAHRRVAGPMAEEMARTAWAEPSFREVDVLVPVGLHRRRLNRRGYNQSEWLAQELSGLLNVPVKMWSCRERDTPPQVGLTRVQRALNVKGAFMASPEANGRRILLVDDVSTTGATARAAATALADAGAAFVGLLTFARDL